MATESIGSPAWMDATRDTLLVQDCIDEPGVFFLGVKPLNKNSVAAARGSRDRVLPVVGRHLCRVIYLETCWDGGRIVPSRTRLNYSLLPDNPMTSAAMVDAALDAAAENGIGWAALRKDQIVGVELVISLPVDFKGDSRAFFVDSLAWGRAEFPQPVTIIAAVDHLDEAAPHLHVVLVPHRRAWNHERPPGRRLQGPVQQAGQLLP